MKAHTKVYLKHHNIGEQDIIMCEECGKRIAKSIHHKKFKSHGGKDNIENLCALCEVCHAKSHGIKVCPN